MSVPVPERLLRLIERLLHEHCILPIPSQFLDERDLVGATPFEDSDIVGKPSQFFFKLEDTPA